MRCLEVGAINYLLKGSIDAPAIHRAVRAALERNTLGALTDLMRDPVTALYTRDGLMTLGTRALETARRSGGTPVLLRALLENLASLQQHLSARNAEQTLRELGELLSSSFRRTDVVARMGDAQFAALAVDAASQSAPVLLQRVPRRLNTLNQLRDATGAMQVRMAVSFWSPEEARPFGELLDNVESELRSEREVPAKHGEQPVNAMGGCRRP